MTHGLKISDYLHSLGPMRPKYRAWPPGLLHAVATRQAPNPGAHISIPVYNFCSWCHGSKLLLLQFQLIPKPSFVPPPPPPTSRLFFTILYDYSNTLRLGYFPFSLSTLIREYTSRGAPLSAWVCAGTYVSVCAPLCEHTSDSHSCALCLSLHLALSNLSLSLSSTHSFSLPICLLCPSLTLSPVFPLSLSNILC